MAIKDKINLTVDRRTFVIVVVIVAIALPVIIFVFKKSFFPIIISIKNIFTSDMVSDGVTGLPTDVRNAADK